MLDSDIWISIHSIWIITRMSFGLIVAAFIWSLWLLWLQKLCRFCLEFMSVRATFIHIWQCLCQKHQLSVRMHGWMHEHRFSRGRTCISSSVTSRCVNGDWKRRGWSLLLVLHPAAPCNRVKQSITTWTGSQLHQSWLTKECQESSRGTTLFTNLTNTKRVCNDTAVRTIYPRLKQIQQIWEASINISYCTDGIPPSTSHWCFLWFAGGSPSHPLLSLHTLVTRWHDGIFPFQLHFSPGLNPLQDGEEDEKPDQGQISSSV